MRKKIFRLQIVALICAFTFQTITQKSFHQEVLSQIDLSDAKYKLPFRAGTSHFMIQGSKTLFTHRAYYTHSWDFVMLPGTEILAARSGTVVRIKDKMGLFGSFHGNHIVIEHEDGTKAEYAHIRAGSARVEPGDFVKQGQIIAVSGMVLATFYPHLHFSLMSADNSSTLPVVFEDAKYIHNIGFYTSKNNIEANVSTSSIRQ